MAGRGDCSALCAADGQNALNPPFVMQPAKRFLQTLAHLVLCCGLSLLRQIGAAVADACLCKHGIPCKIRRDGRAAPIPESISSTEQPIFSIVCFKNAASAPLVSSVAITAITAIIHAFFPAKRRRDLRRLTKY